MQIIIWRRWLTIALRLSSPARRRVPPSVPPPSHFSPHSSSPVCLSHLSVCQNDSTAVSLSLSPSCVNTLSNFYLFLLSSTCASSHLWNWAAVTAERVHSIVLLQRTCMCLKAGTHSQSLDVWSVWRDSDEVGNGNLFGVFSCVGSFRSHSDVVCSDSTCEVWGGGLSDVWAIGYSDWLCVSWMAILIGGVCGIFYALCSIISCFHVLEHWHETGCYYVRSGRINLCSFGNASLHVYYAAVFVWKSEVLFWWKVERVACINTYKPLVQRLF